MIEPQTQLNLIDRLKRFNAKERYWLIRQAFGQSGKDGEPSTLVPSRQFLIDVARAAGVDPPQCPEETFVAIDYHLNWLHAALSPASPDSKSKHSNVCAGLLSGTMRRVVENNQEDIDVLIAYERSGLSSTACITQLLLIEAKCMTPFSELQLESKLIRLLKIVELARQSRNIDVKLVLAGPPEQQHKPVSVSNITSYLQQEKIGTGPLEALMPAYLKSGVGRIDLHFDPGDSKGFWIVHPPNRREPDWTLKFRPNTRGKRLKDQ